jgi:hypothetical protein
MKQRVRNGTYSVIEYPPDYLLNFRRSYKEGAIPRNQARKNSKMQQVVAAREPQEDVCVVYISPFMRVLRFIFGTFFCK